MALIKAEETLRPKPSFSVAILAQAILAQELSTCSNINLNRW